MIKTILSGDFSIFSEAENDKTLDFRHFVELIIELENSKNNIFMWKHQMCHSWLPAATLKM